MARLRTAMSLAVALALSLPAPRAATSFDGGRSDLPGMRRDMFDDAKRKKGKQAQRKAPPECPKSDSMSPFYGLAFVGTDLYVKLNSTEEKCSKLVSASGANFTVLVNASRTCGPGFEVKQRIAENLSAVFFQGGLDWVKNENDTIRVVTEDGTFDIPVSEAKWAAQTECWAKGCGCEQAAHPIGKAVLHTMLVIAVGGLLLDSARLSWKKYRDERPPKHVTCPREHKLTEIQFHKTNFCDVCGKRGTKFQCHANKCCVFDMCQACNQAAKQKLKDRLEAWYERKPEEREKDEEKERLKREKEKKKTEVSHSQQADSEAETTPRAESETDAASGAGSESGKAESSKHTDDEGANL